MRLTLLFYLLTVSMALYATESTEKPSSPYYGYLQIGNNIGSTQTGQIESNDHLGSSPAEWGIGVGRFITHNISVDGILEYWGERFERKDSVIIPGTYDNNIQVTSMGLSAAATYHYTKNPYHAYISAGLGYFSTGILVTDPDSGKFTDKGAPSDQWLVGYHASMGVDYYVGSETWFGIELKQRILDADFGVYTHGKTNVGGTYLFFVLKGGL